MARRKRITFEDFENHPIVRIWRYMMRPNPDNWDSDDATAHLLFAAIYTDFCCTHKIV